MNDWQLFIDESGAFWLDERVVLGGLLVKQPDTARYRANLRGAIALARPGVPWPPHATDLNLPVAHVYAGLLLGNHPDDRVTSAIEVLKEVDPGFAVHGPDSRLPGRAELEDADEQLLDRHPSLHADLQQVVADQARAMHSLLLIHASALVASGWHFRGVEDDEARYLEALQALVERVSLLLPDGDLLCVQAARYRRVSVHEVATAVRKALAKTHSQLRTIVHEPAAYGGNQDLHPGLVLADFVANRIGRLPYESRLAWRSAARLLRTECGLPVEGLRPGGKRLLPGAAVCGTWRDLVQAAFEGTPAELLVAALPRQPYWATDQATLWIQELS